MFGLLPAEPEATQASSGASSIAMKCGLPFRAEIEQVANARRPDLPLFRYAIFDEASDRIVFDGVAGDVREAMDSVNAWLDYLRNSAAA